MTESEAQAWLNALVLSVRARIPQNAPAASSFAEIAWMTDEEVSERHRLISGLASQGSAALSARLRIKSRHVVNADA